MSSANRLANLPAEMRLRLAPLWWGIGALLVVVDVAASLAPQADVPSLLPDKAVHFMTYFVLAFWFVSLAARRRFVSLTGVILLGGVLEILQGMTSSRQPEWLDMLANVSGAVLGLVVATSLPMNLFDWLERRFSSS